MVPTPLRRDPCRCAGGYRCNPDAFSDQIADPPGTDPGFIRSATPPGSTCCHTPEHLSAAEPATQAHHQEDLDEVAEKKPRPCRGPGQPTPDGGIKARIYLSAPRAPWQPEFGATSVGLLVKILRRPTEECTLLVPRPVHPRRRSWSQPAAGLTTSCSCRRRLSRTSPGCKWDRPRRSFRPSCLSVRPPEIQHGRRYTSCTREEYSSVLLSPVQAYLKWCRLATRSGCSRGRAAVWVSLPFGCR
jgi:hypothetical protein